MSFDRIRCVIMRGGTSKAVFFHENDLPSDRESRDRVILRAFGSPDLRQIDGLGGGPTPPPARSQSSAPVRDPTPTSTTPSARSAWTCLSSAWP